MKIVYLDQNYLSRMAKATAGLSSDPDAEDLRDQLLRLQGENRIVVPFSLAHVYETALYDNDDARSALESLLGRLSAGFCFRFGADGLATEIESLATGVPGVPPASWLGRNADCYPNDARMAPVRAALEGAEPHKVFWMFVGILRNDEEGLRKIREAKEDALRAEQSRDVDEPALTMAALVSRHVEGYLSNKMIRSVVQSVASSTGVDIKEIIARMRSGNMAGVPTLSLAAHLRAARDADRQMKSLPGDFFDSAHAIHAAASDLIALDRRTASLIQQVAKSLGRDVVGSLDALRERLDAV